jgi:hypothetical protein
MKLNELKEWLNSLPEEFGEYPCVNGEETKIDEVYHYRVDKPIIAGYVDEETKEVVLCHQLIERNNGDEQNN